MSSRTSRPNDGLFANEEESIYGRYNRSASSPKLPLELPRAYHRDVHTRAVRNLESRPTLTTTNYFLRSEAISLAILPTWCKVYITLCILNLTQEMECYLSLSS